MTTQPLNVFVSSRMMELAAERKALYEFLQDLTIGSYHICPWIFEFSANASEESTRDVYLEVLREADLYVGLFWKTLGDWTKDEYDFAADSDITRHVYFKHVDTHKRAPKLSQFHDQQSNVESGINLKYFTTTQQLCHVVQASITEWLQDQLWRPGAPSATLARKLADVPDLPDEFIGRQALLDEAERLLGRGGKPVLLQGFGGTGKTALAAHLAARYLARQQKPILWLRTGTDTADSIFNALASTFNAQDRLANQPDSKKDGVIRGLLTRRKVKLLVLDDVWNAKALLRVIEALGGHIPIVVTSRTRYPTLRHLEVDRLNRPESLALLSHYAGADWSADKGAEDLCDLLDDLAFALRIAGLTLAVDEIPPDELRERIAERPDAMEVPEDFAKEGQQSVAALLQVSLKALSDLGSEGKDARAVFYGFGAFFVPTATPELLTLYLKRNQKTVDVDTALATLQRRGLADRITPAKSADSEPPMHYYRIHDLAYSFSRAMLPKPKKEARRLLAAEACKEYITHYAHRLPALDTERDNLLAAADFAHQHRRIDLLIDMMRLFSVGLGDDNTDKHPSYFDARGHTPQTIRLLETAAGKAKRKRQWENAYYCLTELGFTYNNFIGDYKKALTTHRSALRMAEKLENTKFKADTLRLMGHVHFQAGAKDADKFYEEAEHIARAANYQEGLAKILQYRANKAITDKKQPDYKTGWRYADEAAKLAKTLNLPDVLFYALQNRGACEHELGQLETALATHQQAYQIAERQGNHVDMAEALWSIGEDYHKLDQRPQAQQAFSQSLKFFRQSGGQAQAKDLTQFMRTNDYEVQ